MKYMLLIHSPENSWTKDEWTKCAMESSAICHELAAKGQFLAASPLHPVATAKTVRVREGRQLVTAGPFTETTEQLGGYYVVDVPNLDEAIALAGRLPPAKKGTVEIRPVFDLPGLPEEKRVPPEGRKKFMMLSYDDEQYWKDAGEEKHRAAMNQAVQLTHKLDARGQYMIASPLHMSETATSVRVRDGKRIVTDGPFAETHEVLGGYYILALNSIDEALEIAAQHPGVVVGSVEIRQIYELNTLPAHDDCEIVNTRDLPFPRAAVFAAFSDPQRLARWWGPKGFTNTFEQCDFRNGGQWKFVMHGPNGADYPNESVFEAIAAPERIVVDHLSSPKFRLTISLDELASDRTRITWRMRFATPELRDQIAKIAVDANEQNFDRLTTEVQTGNP